MAGWSQQTVTFGGQVSATSSTFVRDCQRLGQTTIERAEAHVKREVAHVDVGLLHSWFASSECTAGFSSPARRAHASATTTGSTATAESRSTRYR